MRILIARHGQTDWNVVYRIQGKTDIPLNENGRAQAKALCRNLKDGGYRICRIYSSFQKWALATAEAVGKGFGAPVTVIRGLEEMNLGIFEAHSWAEVMAEFPDEYDAFQKDRRYHVIREGESYQLVLEHFFRALDEALSDAQSADGGLFDTAASGADNDSATATHKTASGADNDGVTDAVAAIKTADSDEDILLVTHGGVMMPILALRDELPFSDAWKRPIPNAEPVVFTRAELEAIRTRL